MMALDGGIRALVDFHVTPPFGSNMVVVAAAGRRRTRDASYKPGLFDKRGLPPRLKAYRRQY